MTQTGRSNWRTAVCKFKRPSVGSKTVHHSLMEKNKKYGPSTMQSLLMAHGSSHLKLNNRFVLSVKTKTMSGQSEYTRSWKTDFSATAESMASLQAASAPVLKLHIVVVEAKLDSKTNVSGLGWQTNSNHILFYNPDVLGHIYIFSHRHLAL